MTTVIVYLIFIFNFIISIIHPWIGLVITSVFVILTPHNIWYWAFAGIRPVAYAFVPVIIGTVLLFLRNRVSFEFIKSKLSISVLIMWLGINISYYFGSYVKVVNEYRFYDPSFVLVNLNKTIMYSTCIYLLIDNFKKFKYIVYIIPASCLYMIYWANKQYLIGGMSGRLRGPSGFNVSIYGDENAFAMFFVATIPFLFFLSFGLSKKYLKYLVLFFVPLGWHAVFLTGSRGGMLGLLCVTILTALRSPNKILKIILLPTLIVAFLWQGGELVKNRMDTLENYQVESSASSRIEAWSAALNMIKEHPVTGVGIGSFGQAFPDFSNKEPRIAHNTFLQLSSECGILTGSLFLFIIFYPIITLWKIANKLKEDISDDQTRFIYLTSESCISSLLGFFVCSLFLSLHEYDIFYVLVAISNFVAIYGKQKIINNEQGYP